MKKIAHFIDTNVPGGAEVLIVEICKNLFHYNFQPEIMHFGNPWLQEKCKELNIPSVIVPGYKLYKFSKTIPIFTLVFNRLLKQRNISILHSHLFAPIVGACLATFLSRTAHIGTLHDTYTIEQKKTRVRLLQMASILGVRLITVSQSMQDYLMTLGKFPKGTVKTIFNGVDIEKFARLISSVSRQDFHLKTNDIVFICVGRLVEIKRHDILIESFSRLKPNKHVKLLIVGEGPCRQSMEDLIIKKRMPDNIKILGFREDVPELLKMSDCFVLSSRSEGLSYSIIEAMASGLPLIVTNVGGNHELVIDEENGYLIPFDEPDAFTEKLQILIDDKEKRKQFGERSRMIVQKKFSIDSMMQEYIKIYTEIV